jgi:enoyl-CoA hydratase
MSFQTILTETHGAVTLVRLNRPQALNALNIAVLAELITVFAAFDADPAQRCLVLTGSEKAFAAGADIKEMQLRCFSAMYGENFFAGFERIVAPRKPWSPSQHGKASRHAWSGQAWHHRS